jgi:hypothetical protein
VLGLVTLTVLYRFAQTELPVPSSDVGLSDKINDVQKLLLESEQNMSKWLLGLAYGTVVAILGARFRDQSETRMIEALPLCALSFLLVAIYAAFLFLDGTVFVLSKGPLYQMYGPVLQIPLLAQFWCLVIALGLLAVWLYGPRKSAVKLIITLIMLMSTALQGAAQDNTKSNKCISKWRTSRGVSEVTDAQAMAVLSHLKTKTHYHPPSTADCDYMFTVLDAVRTSWAIDVFMRTAQGVSPLSIQDYLSNVDASFTAPGLSESDIASRLVQLTALWRQASGILEVEAPDPNSVLVDDALIGITTTMVRLPVGTYHLEVRNAKNVRVLKSTVTVKDNSTTRVSIESKQ